MNVSPKQKKKVQKVQRTNVVSREVTDVNWKPGTMVSAILEDLKLFKPVDLELVLTVSWLFEVNKKVQ